MVTTNELTANGVTYGVHGQGHDEDCYAIFRMTAVKASDKWQSCNLVGKIIHICVIIV